MNQVFLLIDENKNVVALYDSADLAQKMQKPIEEKLNVKVTIEKRTVNLELSTIGVLK